MGGFFGVVSKHDCVSDLYFGTDYHSHLGTKRGGMAVLEGPRVQRYIHNIENTQFRSKFEDDIPKMAGRKGIGVISDSDDQPLIIQSHLGKYAIVTVGLVRNAEALAQKALTERGVHLAELRAGEINQTEVVATLINQEHTFTDGIRRVMDSVEGSCSLLLLTNEGIYAARDKYGRTPVTTGKSQNGMAAALETCALPNLGYQIDRFLGPGEIGLLTESEYRQLKPPEERLQICAFMWVYYGFPASHYENINVEMVRNRCGAALARNETKEVDSVAGIPDSGTGHGLGFAAESHIPFKRPFVKYTPTWPRSFMPQDQKIRDLVATMKLIPIKELIENKRLLFCEDSIVRGTQLQDTIQRLFAAGAQEVHMRPACPPLVYKCKFINFSRSRSEMDLAARKAIADLEGPEAAKKEDLSAYTQTGSPEYEAMVDKIRERLGLTSLRYQRLEDLVAAIGLPKAKLCTYCWDGAE